ncbi:hypothetical protein [Nannocystis radixulma]|uniref:Uncharacterized protein n=1 Tax=Nannocystis radixulma TaxID=2995305 RepID=A0ABT5B0L7_9BACT|nr:hypothetical protein [Nannocystis radixulma]MDC0667635.1 hypothetical protein [Nannocystis radixulma]
MRSLNFAAALAVLLACSPDSPGTSATTGSGTTTGSTTNSTGATTTATAGPVTTTSGSASDSDGTSTAPTTSTTTSNATSTTSTATTEPATSTTSTTSTGPGTSTTDDTSGVDAQCLPAVGDYGECAAVLGWAFDGVECTMRSGCDCAPDCDKFFPTAVACATSCAAADHCNPDRFDAAGIAEPPVAQGAFCDGVYMCPADDFLKDAYQQIFGMLTCEPGGFPCSQNGEHCAGLFAGSLGPEEWAKMCAASLLPTSGPFFCTVFGP